MLRRILKNKLKKNRTTQSFIWKKKILRDFALGIDFEEADEEKTRILERKAEIEKLRKRREERAVRKAQREEEAEARARIRARTVLNLKKKKKKKKTGLCLLLLLKNSKEGFKRPWEPEPGRRRTLKK